MHCFVSRRLKWSQCHCLETKPSKGSSGVHKIFELANYTDPRFFEYLNYCSPIDFRTFRYSNSWNLAGFRMLYFSEVRTNLFFAILSELQRIASKDDSQCISKEGSPKYAFFSSQGWRKRNSCKDVTESAEWHSWVLTWPAIFIKLKLSQKAAMTRESFREQQTSLVHWDLETSCFSGAWIFSKEVCSSMCNSIFW